VALVDGHETGDHVETGRLAGAVRAEQADRLAGAHAHGGAVDDLAAAIALGQAARDQRALHPVRPRRLRRASDGCEPAPPFHPATSADPDTAECAEAFVPHRR
jgi:hypothetical protein